jgi:hypothetical protein
LLECVLEDEAAEGREVMMRSPSEVDRCELRRRVQVR